MTSAMLEATLAKVNEQLKSGIIDCIYSFADGGGSVGIGNADSGEALVEGLQYAASPFLQFEVHPLADFNKVMSSEITAMKKQEPPPPQERRSNVGLWSALRGNKRPGSSV
jgi:hypothetical protein